MAPTALRQNYAQECEAGINKQINMELYANYVYTSMAFYFSRDDVSMGGFHEFFKVYEIFVFWSSDSHFHILESRSCILLPLVFLPQKAAKEESEHAQKFMEFQNNRGGRVVLKDIKKPEKDEWGTGLEAMKAALELEKQVSYHLFRLGHLLFFKIYTSLRPSSFPSFPFLLSSYFC